MIESGQKKWFPYGIPNSSATLRLFCFPYAGGGASLYREWATFLDPQVQVVPVQLPGREQRFIEKAFDDLDSLVKCLFGVLSPYFNLPYAFFGHSMGSLIAFELSQYCLEHNTSLPQKLFLSSFRAPQIERKSSKNLTDEKIFKRMTKLNGMPKEFGENEELKNLYMPLFRADYCLCRRYQYKKSGPLPCSFKIYAGVDDVISLPDLLAWQKQTSGDFDFSLFPGNHFYLKKSKRELLDDMRRELDFL